MLVRERMSKPVITIHPKMAIMEALNLMKKEKIRRLPVVNKRGHLIGIVSDKDLLHASPSIATSLSAWEISYLVSKITVKEIMTKEVITISEDTPLEEAARIMADNKIGGLPIVRNGDVVGMITETDLFKVFLELMGAREPGVRFSCLVPNIPGELAQLTKAIYEAGGNILALGTFLGESSEDREITMKVDGITPESLESVVDPFIEKNLDIRESDLK
jgi:acetoin utilization protein AcuB